MSITLRTDVNPDLTTDTSQITGVVLDAISDGAEDDLLIALGGWSDNDGTWNLITDFTEDVDTATGAGDDRSLGLQHKLHTDSEGATYSLTGTAASASGQGCSGLLCALDGVDTTTPIDVAAVTKDQSSSSSPTPSAITTVTDGAWVILAIIHSHGNITAFVPPTGYTLIGSVINGSDVGDGANIALAYKEVATAGLETPGSWSLTGSANDDSTMATIAIRPATGGGGGGDALLTQQANNQGGF